MAIIGKFLASKWVTVTLILALAGGAYYVFRQGKLIGSAEELIDAYEVTIAQQSAANERLAKEIQSKEDALTTQSFRVSQLRKNARLQQLAVQEAIKHADKVTRECMALHLADGLQFGPDAGNASSEDKARSDLDG